MLQKEVQTFLTDTLGMDIEALKNAMTSDEEVEVKYKPGTFMDDESLEELKNKVKQNGYEEGKTVGFERKLKEIKEEHGLQGVGMDYNKVLEAFAAKKLEDAKIEPNKKNKELEESLANLQKTVQTLEQEKESVSKQWETRYKNEKINNELQRYFPELNGIKPGQAAILARTDFDFDYSDDQLIVKRNGKILKDKMENPLNPKDVLTEWSQTNGWIKQSGRGGVDEPGGKRFKSEHEVYKYLEENKIQPDSEEAQTLINEFKTD